jgi:hypothetical protein
VPRPPSSVDKQVARRQMPQLRGRVAWPQGRAALRMRAPETPEARWAKRVPRTRAGGRR